MARYKSRYSALYAFISLIYFFHWCLLHHNNDNRCESKTKFITKRTIVIVVTAFCWSVYVPCIIISIMKRQKMLESIVYNNKHNMGIQCSINANRFSFIIFFGLSFTNRFWIVFSCSSTRFIEPCHYQVIFIY